MKASAARENGSVMKGKPQGSNDVANASWIKTVMMLAIMPIDIDPMDGT